jgi:hypothetical protein
VTLAFHALGVVVLARWLDAAAASMARRGAGGWRPALAATAMLGAVGCALAVLHGVEAAIWAVAYIRLGALDSFAPAILYSLDSLTTRGESGLQLAGHWRLMGAIEAANGSLLFGVSTAFLFAVIGRAWDLLRVRRHARSPVR